MNIFLSFFFRIYFYEKKEHRGTHGSAYTCLLLVNEFRVTSGKSTDEFMLGKNIHSYWSRKLDEGQLYRKRGIREYLLYHYPNDSIILILYTVQVKHRRPLSSPLSWGIRLTSARERSPILYRRASGAMSVQSFVKRPWNRLPVVCIRVVFVESRKRHSSFHCFANARVCDMVRPNLSRVQRVERPTTRVANRLQ